LKPYRKVIGEPKMSLISQPLETVKEDEKMGKKIKREVKAEAPGKAAPEAKKTALSEDKALETMEVGVLYSSTQLADALELKGEGRRDIVRRVMAKLAKDGKVKITETAEAKRKQYRYELVEEEQKP
jgi:hypothetical protein